MLVNLGMFRYMYMKLLKYDISTENVNVHLDRSRKTFIIMILQT